ncbi:MAG: hypothetical protein KM296_02225 [Brockia lithotrophica]|nr:hypothetical protein [Brockia lithotrophica]
MLGRAVLLLMGIGGVLSLGGCWDKAELEDIVFASAIGIDRAEQPGRLDVTFELMNTKKASIPIGQTAQEEPNVTHVTVRNTTPIWARDIANSVVTRRINISHVQTIVIGEELVRQEDLFVTLAAALRDPEMRRATPIIVTRERAEDFLRNNRPRFETLPYIFYRFKLNRWKDTGTVPISTLNEFLRAYSIHAGYLVTYATARRDEGPEGSDDRALPGELRVEGGDPVEMIGSVALARGKMVGALTGYETRFALLLGNQLHVATYLIGFRDPVDPTYYVSTRIQNWEGPRIHIDVSRDIPRITVDIPFRVEVLSVPSRVDYVNDAGKRKLLHESIRKEIESAFRQVVHRAQHEFETDIFGWSRFALRLFPTWEDYRRYDFPGKFPRANVDVHVDVKIINFGKTVTTEEESPEPKMRW